MFMAAFTGHDFRREVEDLLQQSIMCRGVKKDQAIVNPRADHRLTEQFGRIFIQ
jgi:hypothetical protein